MTFKVITVYGTRPEAIKVAPMIRALEADERFESVTISTGQHREMLDQVNAMFSISPDYDLALMRRNQSLNDIVSRAVAGLDEVFTEEKPDAVIAQGDTTTAMAAAVAAFNREVPVIHLEAGLRTGNIHSPFPEEANRRIIGQVAELHLAPTMISKQNLVRENFNPSDIAVVGNTVIDALLTAATWDTRFEDVRLNALMDSDARVVVVTTHRRENLDAMTQIGLAVQDLSNRYPNVTIVLPLHLNPKVRDAVLPEVDALANVIVTDPLPYDEFTKLMQRSDIVLTDSGGVQEEAPSLGKPVICMRENTERPEAVEAGTVKLVGTDRTRIVSTVSTLLDDAAAYQAMARATNPYGDGHAAERSVAAIAHLLGNGERLPDFTPTSAARD